MQGKKSTKHPVKYGAVKTNMQTTATIYRYIYKTVRLWKKQFYGYSQDAHAKAI